MSKEGKKSRRVLTGGERLIACCGLYCGDCSGYKGTIANLARDLHKELERERFADLAKVLAKIPFFKAFEGYPQCRKVLETLPKLRCNKTCRGDGGPPYCEIRMCNRDKGYDGCWQCDLFRTCTKLNFLRDGHGDAHLRNLRKIKHKGTTAFLEGKRHWRTNAVKRRG
ncbi:MAG: DUF3795 domain-containing protein [Sedimentisphaerales bacterium]|nr:DUF3795 domain-containing protein [Sedimentisphaerales bacterium]